MTPADILFQSSVQSFSKELTQIFSYFYHSAGRMALFYRWGGYKGRGANSFASGLEY